MNSEKVITEINELIEQWIAAIRKQDMEKILAHHAKDIVIFDVPPPFQSRGIEEYRKTWELFFSWAKKPVEFSVTEIEIIASDSVAFWYGIGHCSSIGPKGEEENIDFRLTVGLRKINEKWVILHEHHSLPSE